MKLKLSADKKTIERARKIAQSLGKSLNQLIRDDLNHLTAAENASKDIEELMRLSVEGNGRSRGLRFNRDEIHERT